MLETLKMHCPDSIGISVRNESEWVSGMDRNTHNISISCLGPTLALINHQMFGIGPG